MRLTTRTATMLTVIAVLLCAFQAGLWAKSASHLKNETVEQNKEIRHPPSELPGVAGFTLLVVTGVLLSFPKKPYRAESGEEQEEL